jgi:hypothetical protein
VKGGVEAEEGHRGATPAPPRIDRESVVSITGGQAAASRPTPGRMTCDPSSIAMSGWHALLRVRHRPLGASCSPGSRPG